MALMPVGGLGRFCEMTIAGICRATIATMEGRYTAPMVSQECNLHARRCHRLRPAGTWAIAAVRPRTAARNGADVPREAK